MFHAQQCQHPSGYCIAGHNLRRKHASVATFMGNVMGPESVLPCGAVQKTLLLESAMIPCHCIQLEASSNPHRQERMKAHLETSKLSVPNLTPHPLHPACICIARAPHAVSKNEKDALEFACFPWWSDY